MDLKIDPVSWAVLIALLGAIVRYGQIQQSVADIAKRVERIETMLDRRATSRG